MKVREIITSLDWILLGAVLLLVLLSLAMLFSTREVGSIPPRFTRQAIALGIGLVLSFSIARLPYHNFRNYAFIWYAIGLVGLLVVYFGGEVIRGTTSRLELYGLQFQPSEFMKVIVILSLASVLARRKEFSWSTTIGSAIVVGLPVALILFEPDLGTAALLMATWGAVLVFFGLPWLITVGLLGMVALGGWAAWQWLLVDYQKARLLVFLNPNLDPLGQGYNVAQSIVALGSGRLLGRGLGHGPQSQLLFLPERHTDFILASIGEELGLIGVLIVLTLYVIVLWRILKIARHAQDTFGELLAVGTFLLLLISLFVAGGMNIGLLPVTGIPLPLLSYGGSNLVSTWLLIGIVQSVRLYSKWTHVRPTEITHLT